MMASRAVDAWLLAGAFRRRGGAARRGSGRRLIIPDWRLALEQALQLLAGERLEFEQPLGQRLQVAAFLGENLLRLLIAVFDQPPDFAVDLLHGCLGDVLLARHRITQEHLFLVFAVRNGAERIG